MKQVFESLNKIGQVDFVQALSPNNVIENNIHTCRPFLGSGPLKTDISIEDSTLFFLPQYFSHT